MAIVTTTMTSTNSKIFFSFNHGRDLFHDAVILLQQTEFFKTTTTTNQQEQEQNQEQTNKQTNKQKQNLAVCSGNFGIPCHFFKYSRPFSAILKKLGAEYMQSNCQKPRLNDHTFSFNIVFLTQNVRCLNGRTMFDQTSHKVSPHDTFSRLHKPCCRGG